MYCSNCGSKVNDEARFCEKCGARVGTQGMTQGAENLKSSNSQLYNNMSQTTSEFSKTYKEPLSGISLSDIGVLISGIILIWKMFDKWLRVPLFYSMGTWLSYDVPSRFSLWELKEFFLALYDIVGRQYESYIVYFVIAVFLVIVISQVYAVCLWFQKRNNGYSAAVLSSILAIIFSIAFILAIAYLNFEFKKEYFDYTCFETTNAVFIVVLAGIAQLIFISKSGKQTAGTETQRIYIEKSDVNKNSELIGPIGLKEAKRFMEQTLEKEQMSDRKLKYLSVNDNCLIENIKFGDERDKYKVIYNAADNDGFYEETALDIGTGLSMEYYTGGNVSKLIGYAYAKGNEGHGGFKVYGDGKMIYSSGKILPTSGKIRFNINIECFGTIKIESDANGLPVRLVNTEFRRD